MDLRSRPPICFQDDPLYEILNRFQTGKSECVQTTVTNYFYIVDMNGFCIFNEIQPQLLPPTTVQVAMCTYLLVHTLLNALVLRGKTPPVQVAAGDDHHECK